MAGKLTLGTIGKLKDGRHGDGLGLWLQVRNGGRNRSWLFTYTSPKTGKIRQAGLGPYPLIGLADAREARGEMRLLIRQRVDPLEQRNQKQAAQAEREKREKAAAVTFKAAAEEYMAAHRAGWKNAAHARQWPRSLVDYVYPHLGEIPCAAITTANVLAVLTPVWSVKSETAKRVRARIESVLDYAKAKGWRSGENVAAWRGNLAFTLPARAKVAPVKHHAAMPWQDVPAFMRQLAGISWSAALALRFTILTATRTGETLGARWGEIGREARVWTLPAERMKAKREHRVPLSDAAMAVLAEAERFGEAENPRAFVFAGTVPMRGLTDRVMHRLLRREGHSITVHGFRSSFRDWCGEATNHPREVVEQALAHRLGDAAEQAYARGDLFQKRRRLMEEWADFCTAPASDVVALRTAVAT